MKTLKIIIVTVILAGGIGSAVTFYYVDKKATDDKSSLQKQIDQLQSQNSDLKKASANTSATASGQSSTATTSTPTTINSSTANINSAKAVVTNFLDAKKTRSLENAKPYMTASLYASSNQDSFAGTSSPSMGRYTIQSGEYLTAADLYQVKVRVYQNLGGQEAGYSDNTYNVVNQSGQFLVNEVKDGKWINL